MKSVTVLKMIKKRTFGVNNSISKFIIWSYLQKTINTVERQIYEPFRQTFEPPEMQ